MKHSVVDIASQIKRDHSIFIITFVELFSKFICMHIYLYVVVTKTVHRT